MDSNGEWGAGGGGVRPGVDLQEEWIGGGGLLVMGGVVKRGMDPNGNGAKGKPGPGGEDWENGSAPGTAGG